MITVTDAQRLSKFLGEATAVGDIEIQVMATRDSVFFDRLHAANEGEWDRNPTRVESDPFEGDWEHVTSGRTQWKTTKLVLENGNEVELTVFGPDLKEPRCP